MIFDDLAPGEDLGMVESNRPNVHLHEFRNGQLRAVAAGSRGSYSSIARDYNGTYSAQRQNWWKAMKAITYCSNGLLVSTVARYTAHGWRWRC